VVLTPKKGGRMKTARARVRYAYAGAAGAAAGAVDEGGDEAPAPVVVQASSTTPGMVDIVSVAVYERATAATAAVQGAAAYFAAIVLLGLPAYRWHSAERRAVAAGKSL